MSRVAEKIKQGNRAERERASSRPRRQNASATRLEEALAVAGERGLLTGPRTQVVRGRMPAALVERAKQRSGISSDSKLLEVALANLAVADDYGEWLVSQSGTVDPELDLEF